MGTIFKVRKAKPDEAVEDGALIYLQYKRKLAHVSIGHFEVGTRGLGISWWLRQ